MKIFKLSITLDGFRDESYLCSDSESVLKVIDNAFLRDFTDAMEVRIENDILLTSSLDDVSGFDYKEFVNEFQNRIREGSLLRGVKMIKDHFEVTLRDARDLADMVIVRDETAIGYGINTNLLGCFEAALKTLQIKKDFVPTV
jgi:hypothetical protein